MSKLQNTNKVQIIISFGIYTIRNHFTPLHFQANICEQEFGYEEMNCFNRICLNLKVTVVRVTFPYNNISNADSGPLL